MVRSESRGSLLLLAGGVAAVAAAGAIGYFAVVLTRKRRVDRVLSEVSPDSAKGVTSALTTLKWPMLACT